MYIQCIFYTHISKANSSLNYYSAPRERMSGALTMSEQTSTSAEDSGTPLT